MDAQLDQNLIDEFVQISQRNFGRVRQLLIRHPNLVDSRATWGETALEAALHAGQQDIADFLLSAGAELHECTGACQTKIERLNTNHDFPSFSA